MSLNKYLIELLIQEQSIIEELLIIDNKIQFTSLTYNQLLNILQNITIDMDDLPVGKYDVITDGEINTTLKCLISYAPLINRMNINKRYVGVNKWFIKNINEYYKRNKININILLDIDNNYSQYTDSKFLIICGFKEFIDGTLSLFNNKSVIKIEM